MPAHNHPVDQTHWSPLGLRVLMISCWSPFFGGLLLVSSLLSWHSLSKVNFAYSAAYPVLSIDKHIEKFAPQNRFKRGFENTSIIEHQQLFNEIVTAIQNQGLGLDSISYQGEGKEPTLLLRQPEILHLQDVAHLIDKFYALSAFVGVLSVLSIFACFKLRLPLPKLQQVIVGFTVFVLSLTACVFIIGAERVFYWLHTMLFPADNPWFFYYQDSLMTTLMKAPDLFGFIAVLLVTVAIAVFLGVLKALYYFYPIGSSKEAGCSQIPEL